MTPARGTAGEDPGAGLPSDHMQRAVEAAAAIAEETGGLGLVVAR